MAHRRTKQELIEELNTLRADLRGRSEQLTASGKEVTELQHQSERHRLALREAVELLRVCRSTDGLAAYCLERSIGSEPDSPTVTHIVDVGGFADAGPAAIVTPAAVHAWQASNSRPALELAASAWLRSYAWQVS